MKIKKTVYTQSIDTARENGELERYHESRQINADCAKAIYKSIADSNYKPNFYDLKTAAKNVIERYGEKRVSWVTANTIQFADNDGRYSSTNKEWAKGFEIPQAQRQSYLIMSHPCLVDGFADRLREICAELKLARAEKRASRADATIQSKPTLKERLEDGMRKAAERESPGDKPKTKQREGIE